MQPRLIGLKAPVMGLTVNLSPIETTLGREVGNTVVLNSSSVSRRHAHIVPQGDGFAIEDLGSANGVRLNGVPIAGLTLLHNGDQLDLGEISLLYEAPVPVTETPPVATPRKPEVGSVERAAQAATFAPPSRAPSDPFGCNPFANLLNDLSGILPAIMKYILPVLLGLLALFCLGSLLMMGAAAIARMMSGGGGSNGAPPPAHSSGQTPPPASSSDNQESDSGSAKITIQSVRVIRVVGPGGVKTPTLLVTWLNASDRPVSELDGTVIVHLADGHSDAYPKMRIYSGPPVQPGQVHSDTGSGDGVVLATDADANPEVLPTEVK